VSHDNAVLPVAATLSPPTTDTAAPDGQVAVDRSTGKRRRVGRAPLGRQNLVIRAASALSLVLIWVVAAAILPSSILPGPLLVIDALATDVQTGILWPNMWVTLTRTLGAFALAMIVATVFGVVMGLNRKAERFFDTWLIVGMTMPALVTIIVVFMVVGLNETGTIIAAAAPTLAMLTINVWEGIKGIDTKLIHMARAFRVPRSRVVSSVIMPQVAPTLMASARFGLGLVWKMILFIELLGRSDGVGYQIQFNYMLFNMSQVLAWALAFLVVMLVIEIGVFGFIERKLFHWRPKVHQA
jgi:NitT/TauT family transport system permease protein